MKHKFSIAIAAAALAACCMGMSVSAYTPDDVAAKARAAGWPENLIQMGYNEWASGQYTQEDLDAAYNAVYEYDGKANEVIKDALTSPTEAATDPAVSDPATGPATEATAGTDVPATETAATEAATQAPTEVTKEDFVSMTLDEKIDHMGTLSADEQQELLDSLTADERNSIIKQLPIKDKTTLMQSYIDTAETMGLHVSVDNITNSDLSLTVRDDAGTVVDKTAMGMTIENTGISYTQKLLIAAAGILVSLLGFGLLYRYLRKTEE